jgi:hypothetical protein
MGVTGLGVISSHGPPTLPLNGRPLADVSVFGIQLFDLRRRVAKLTGPARGSLGSELVAMECLSCRATRWPTPRSFWDSSLPRALSVSFGFSSRSVSW